MWIDNFDNFVKCKSHWRSNSSLDIQRNIGKGKRSLTIKLHTSDSNSCKMVASTSRRKYLINYPTMNNECVFVQTPIPDVFTTCVCSGTCICTLRPLNIINNGDKWKCSVTENKQARFSDEKTIIITVPVGYSTLIPDVPTISVLTNVEISYIRCVSSVGRPAPTITWYLDNRTPSDNSNGVNLTRYNSSSTVADVTTSNLTMTPSANYHDARINCNVSNGYGQIMYSYPTKPTIKYNTVFAPSSISVIQNSSMTLKCSSSGNPEPSFSWTLFNGSLISSSVITFNVATNNDKDQIACSAASVLDPTNGPRIAAGNTTVLTVNVLNAPDSLFKLAQRILKLMI
ncbi:hemicentin-1-like isoform X2 [Dreissena polymorpha]|uniref:hemicentin-1-like isoform X2 n=1 Tax=Dreissena polymorpha TaxID=45954 RepID=UPI002263DB8C|nr:hemicentin-1-like isoform X2 [Dreissena polymorpha]